MAMNIRALTERTPSELLKSSKAANKFFEKINFADFPKRSRLIVDPPIYRGYEWEPETPESVLPSYLAVKRPSTEDRKDTGIYIFKFFIKIKNDVFYIPS